MGIDSINSLFAHFNRSDLTAINCNESEISYSSLFQSSNNISEFLGSKGIKKNDYVAVCTDDKVMFIKTVIAIWILEAVPVPINSKLLGSEINSLLEDHKIKFLITYNIDIELKPFSDLEVFEVKEEYFEESFTKAFKIPSIENEAVIIFTSGSTSKPKGVVHTYSSLISSIENSNSILKQEIKDSWIASLPFYHIGGFQIICRSFFYGCRLIIPPSLQTNDLKESILKFNPTHLSLVSTQLERLIENNISPGNSLKVSLIGGGFIDDELMIKAYDLGWKPYRVYGSSETASLITAISAKEIKSRPASVGKPLPNVKLKISDQSEILINSESVFRYYLENEKETDDRLVNGFYHSGDLGFIDNEGYLFIESRRNDLIVTGGENVNPVEVEKAVLMIKEIKETCVFPQQNKTWGQIVACVIVAENNLIDEKTLKEKLKQMLAGYKIPKKFYFSEKLPRTPLGKLEREKIKKMFK